jgi:hypothetical protein
MTNVIEIQAVSFSTHFNRTAVKMFKKPGITHKKHLLIPGKAKKGTRNT